MMAVFLYLWLGRDAAVAEIVAEILVGLSFVGRGGGGKRLKDGLLLLLEGARQLRLPAPAGRPTAC